MSRPTAEQVARIREALEFVTVDALVTNAHADQLAEELAQALFETVTTAAELDALPVGSVVLDQRECARQKEVLGGYVVLWSGTHALEDETAQGLARSGLLPATVLHRGRSA